MKSKYLALAATAIVSMMMSAPAPAQGTPGASMSEAACPPSVPPGPPGALQALLKPGTPVAMPAPDPNDAQFQAYQRHLRDEFARDFAARCRFKSENAKLTGKVRVVFMGDSITEFWALGDPSLFTNGTVDRGISGQTTPQMLLRFYQDVIALHPNVVHIMAGTNNLAGNTGPNSPEDFKNDIRAMVELAQANGIHVVLASIPPADRFGWRPDLRPAEQIRALNKWLKAYGEQRKLTFVDYYRDMATSAGGMKAELSNDGVHPNTNGYAVMRRLVDVALKRSLITRR